MKCDGILQVNMFTILISPISHVIVLRNLPTMNILDLFFIARGFLNFCQYPSPRRGAHTYTIRPSEEVSQYQGGVVRGAARIAQLPRIKRPRADPGLSVVVVLAHLPDSLCVLPRRMKLIRIGCERIPEDGHGGTSSPNEPNHHWRQDLKKQELEKQEQE